MLGNTEKYACGLEEEWKGLPERAAIRTQVHGVQSHKKGLFCYIFSLRRNDNDNELPADVKTAESLTSFHKRLKTCSALPPLTLNVLRCW